MTDGIDLDEIDLDEVDPDDGGDYHRKRPRGTVYSTRLVYQIVAQAGDEGIRRDLIVARFAKVMPTETRRRYRRMMERKSTRDHTPPQDPEYSDKKIAAWAAEEKLHSLLRDGFIERVGPRGSRYQPAVYRTVRNLRVWQDAQPGRWVEWDWETEARNHRLHIDMMNATLAAKNLRPKLKGATAEVVDELLRIIDAYALR